jgi:uncharacterized membrane protein YfcA
MTTFLLFLFAIFSGVIGGMGMGGGTVFIPLLTLFLGMSQVQAQGLNLVGFWFLAPVALFIHNRGKLINFKAVFLTVAFSVPFSFLGALGANYVDNNLLRTCFGVFLIVISLLEFYAGIKQKNIKSSRQK